MADRPKSSQASRSNPRQRVAQLRRDQQRQERRRAGLIWGGGGVAIIAIVIAAVFLTVNARANRPSLAAVREFNVGGGHVSTAVNYPQAPPVGGAHSPVWLNCGSYDRPVRNENAVHSMEHGAVWLTYRPDLPAGDVDTLRRALPDTYTILSPYPGLTAPVVASAWGRQLTLTGVDDNRLAAFVSTFRQGPQTPEPGAACTGGTSKPAGP